MPWFKDLMTDQQLHDYAAAMLAELEQCTSEKRRAELLAAIAWATEGETQH